jgi:Right handed beta helix region
VAVLAGAAAALALAAPSGSDGRDDTAWLQSKLDGGGTIVLPRLAGGECYATRGLWVSRDDTRIVSDGACVRGLGPGEVRLRSRDGDAIPAEAVFYVSRSRPLDPTPVRITISGLRVEVPDGVELYGISVLGHQVTVQNVEVTGAPIDAVYVGGRANEGFAARVVISDSKLRSGRRNVVSVVGGIDVRIVGNEISGGSDTYPSAPGRPWGNPAAGIDVEPGGRGAPTLGVRIADNLIADNAGPGILLALSTNEGLPVLGSQIEIVGNRILRNGLKATPPQHGGIVFNGGQDAGGGRVLVERNVITGNRGAALQGRADVNLVIEQRDNDMRGNGGGGFAVMRVRNAK